MPFIYLFTNFQKTQNSKPEPELNSASVLQIGKGINSNPELTGASTPLEGSAVFSGIGNAGTSSSGKL
jgi:hypothetical protein